VRDPVTGESFDYSGAPVRVYAPTGTTNDLLAYLVRRMLENGANSSFLKQLADGREHLLNVDVLDPHAPSHTSADDSTPSPPHIKLWAATTGASTAVGASSSSMIPNSPRAIYKGRLAARGVDFEHPDFPALFARTPTFVPEQGAHGTDAIGGASSESIDALIHRLNTGAMSSTRMGQHTTELSQRVAVLREAADIIESEALPLAKLVMEEVGKTVVDAINEVRECVDFFRFYAQQAEKTLVERRLTTVTGEENIIAPLPRGPWLCVGPFNFPFAIVVGLHAELALRPSVPWFQMSALLNLARVSLIGGVFVTPAFRDSSLLD